MATLALALPLSLVVVAGTPSSASAIGSPVTPLSVLPSQVVSGTAPTTGGPLASSSAVRMAQMYKFLTSPATVAALKSQAAGTATKTETDLIAAAARNVKIPAGVGTLAKGAGAVGVAYTGYQVGSWVGSNAAGAITTELWGVDANSLVCSQTRGAGQGFLSFFSGQDCAKFNATADFVPNLDASGSLTMAPLVQGSTTTTFLGTSVVQHTYDEKFDGYWCFRMTGPEPSPAPALVYTTPGGVTDAYTVYASNKNRADSNQRTCGAPDASPVTSGSSTGTRAHAQEWIDKTVLRCLAPFNPQTGYQCENGGSPFVQGSSNPDRYISCDVTGTNSGYLSTSGSMFRETDTDWSKSVPACGALPVGSVPTKTTLTLHTVGGDDQVLWTRDTPPEVLEQLGGKYKTCLQTVCQLILEKNGISCFDGADCTGWFADSSTGTSPNTYTCKYAGQAVALTECTVYKPSWEADALRTGQVLADPVTGQPAPNSPNPQEQASSPVKGTDAGTFGQPVLDPAAERQCFPTGWAVFNPLEWVQKPVQCAFQWAFIPTPAAITAAQTQVQANVDASGLGTIVRNVTVLGAVPIPGNGCGGIPLNFDLGGSGGVHVRDYLLKACPGDTLAPVAAVTKTILSGVISTAAFLAILRYIAQIFGFSGLGGIQQQFAMSDKRAEAAAREAGK